MFELLGRVSKLGWIVVLIIVQMLVVYVAYSLDSHKHKDELKALSLFYKVVGVAELVLVVMWALSGESACSPKRWTLMEAAKPSLQ